MFIYVTFKLHMEWSNKQHVSMQLTTSMPPAGNFHGLKALVMWYICCKAACSKILQNFSLTLIFPQIFSCNFNVLQFFLQFYIFYSMSLGKQVSNFLYSSSFLFHTHTHTHIIYIYIYIYGFPFVFLQLPYILFVSQFPVA